MIVNFFLFLTVKQSSQGLPCQVQHRPHHLPVLRLQRTTNARSDAQDGCSRHPRRPCYLSRAALPQRPSVHPHPPPGPPPAAHATLATSATLSSPLPPPSPPRLQKSLWAILSGRRTRMIGKSKNLKSTEPMIWGTKKTSFRRSSISAWRVEWCRFIFFWNLTATLTYLILFDALITNIAIKSPCDKYRWAHRMLKVIRFIVLEIPL